MITLKADNRVITDGAKYSYITSNLASGYTAIPVINSVGFAAGQFVILGELGNETTEILRVSSASNNVINTSSATKFAHSDSTKIAVIPFDKVVFYYTTTATFSASNVLSISDIQSDDKFTKYTDSTYNVGFGWFRFYNSLTSIFSEESNPIPYADFAENSAKKLIDAFYSALNNNEINLVSREDVMRYMNEAVSRAVNHLNLVNTEYNVIPYTITTTAGTAEYDLPADFGDLISITFPGGLNVDHCDIWEVNYWGATPTNVTKYYLRNKKLCFTPIPQSAVVYSIFYKDISSAIDSIYDTLDFPDNNFYGLIDFMLYRACPKLGRDQREAAAFLAAFNDSMNMMKVTSVKQSANLDRFTIDAKYNR